MKLIMLMERASQGQVRQRHQSESGIPGQVLHIRRGVGVVF